MNELVLKAQNVGVKISQGEGRDGAFRYTLFYSSRITRLIISYWFESSGRVHDV